MNEKKELPIDMLTAFDQTDQTLANTAALCGTYYIALVSNKVPPDLAFKLVLDWHKDFWLQMLNGLGKRE